MNKIKKIIRDIESHYHKGNTSPDFGIRGRIFGILPMWSTYELEDSIIKNDKLNIKRILYIWMELTEMYAKSMSFRKIQSPQYWNEINNRCTINLSVAREVVSTLRAMYLGEYDIPNDSVWTDVMKRVASYDPDDTNNSAPKIVDSINDIQRPGQKISVDAVDADLVECGYDSDIVFFTNDDNSEWCIRWDNSTRTHFPIWPSEERVCIDSDGMKGCHGFLYEYHKTDDSKTIDRLNGYLAAGYGVGKKKKLIFVQQHGYYICLGLGTLDELDVHNSYYGPDPCCLWFFPAFNFNGLTE